jgi:ABC-2 type transport system ATP-binding protein
VCGDRSNDSTAPTWDAMIEFANVSKTYRSFLGRSVRAVEDFSLQVADGEVLGIAGPNGAGKSTLISLLLGFLGPSSGRVTIHGMAPRAYVEQYGIGYLPELVHIVPRWRTRAALQRFSILSGIAGDAVERESARVIDELGLGEHRDKTIKALSKGNLQRLGLAQALLRPYDVYVFDEPTHGLDPVWTQRFREMMTALRRP